MIGKHLPIVYPRKSKVPSGMRHMWVFSSFTVKSNRIIMDRMASIAKPAVPLQQMTKSSAKLTMCAFSMASCPNCFQPNTKRRIERFDHNGEIGEPCGVPRRLSLLRVVRCHFPLSSVSSTGVSGHILIRCSMCRSLTRRATDFIRSAWYSCDGVPVFLCTPGPQLVWSE